jgi:hypothetical protein
MNLRRILGGSAAAAVVMGGGIGIGMALTGGASAATATTTAAPLHARHACAHANNRQAAMLCARRMQRLRLLIGGSIHGQITVKAKTGFNTIAFERGSVQSVSGSTLTVRAADGTTWTWQLVKGSVIRANGGKVGPGKLAAGEQVLVAGPVVSGVNDVKLLGIRS